MKLKCRITHSNLSSDVASDFGVRKQIKNFQNFQKDQNLQNLQPIYVALLVKMIQKSTSCCFKI